MFINMDSDRRLRMLRSPQDKKSEDSKRSAAFPHLKVLRSQTWPYLYSSLQFWWEIQDTLWRYVWLCFVSQLLRWDRWVVGICHCGSLHPGSTLVCRIHHHVFGTKHSIDPNSNTEKFVVALLSANYTLLRKLGSFFVHCKNLLVSEMLILRGVFLQGGNLRIYLINNQKIEVCRGVEWLLTPTHTYAR